MAESSTIRSRRSRAHHRGDHSLCKSDRCDAAQIEIEVQAESTDPAAPAVPILGPSGRALWQEMTASGRLPPMQMLLLREACRLSDRLDRLDEILRGDVEVWARLTHRLLTEDYELKIDGAMAEARQAATAVKQIVAELRQGTAGRGKAAAKPAAKGVGGGVTDIAAKIAARRAAPTG